jgi:hypothetical protein
LGQILAANWEPIWGSDSITGAFIWEWQEQNLAERFPERWSTPSPGARDVDAKGIRLKFLLPAAADRMSWVADSFWTESPAGHIGAPHGSITSKDATFGSSRRDIRWIALSGAGNSGLVALSADKPLHTHASADASGAMLSLSSAIASTGRDVTGDDICVTQATPLTGAFRLRVAGSAK